MKLRITFMFLFKCEWNVKAPLFWEMRNNHVIIQPSKFIHLRNHISKGSKKLLSFMNVCCYCFLLQFFTSSIKYQPVQPSYNLERCFQIIYFVSLYEIQTIVNLTYMSITLTTVVLAFNFSKLRYFEWLNTIEYKFLKI